MHEEEWEVGGWGQQLRDSVPCGNYGICHCQGYSDLFASDVDDEDVDAEKA